MPGLLVKLFLVEVILFLELLRKFPDNIIFEFKEFPLFFIVLKEDLSLSQLSWEIVWEDIDFDLKLLRNSILNVLIQLSVSVQEAKLIWASSLLLGLRCLSL